MSPTPTAESRSLWRGRLTWAFRVVWVRLRFVAVLAVAGATIANWDSLRGRWDALVGPGPRDPSMASISPGTEYFCPMDPGVVSAWPGKCSVCNMFLVVRSKADMSPMPSGVVARVQVSPERILFAGIRTAPVEYRPLATAVSGTGRIRNRQGRWVVVPEIADADRPLVHDGMPARIDVEGLASPKEGIVRLDPADEFVVDFGPSGGDSFENRKATVTIDAPIADRESFRSQPSGVPDRQPGVPRVVFHCSEHPSVTALAPGKCPIGDETLERTPLAPMQAVAWACPAHPEVVSDRSGSTCSACGGMDLAAKVVTYRPDGQVLCVPTSAILDGGARKVVYVESMPGQFDAVEVRVGPSRDGLTSIVSGVEAGRRVVEAGAFLIDAETRLNPRLAASYFGAARGWAEQAEHRKDVDPAGLASLSEDDRRLATRQKTCPVTGKTLGSMGPPPKINLEGATVFLCCEGCEDRLRRDPEKYRKAMTDGPKVGP